MEIKIMLSISSFDSMLLEKIQGKNNESKNIFFWIVSNSIPNGSWLKCLLLALVFVIIYVIKLT